MQFVIEGSKYDDADAVPAPNTADVQVKREAGGVVASVAVGGIPSEADVSEAEAKLRAALVRDGILAAPGYELARYNEPFVLPPFRRNEVLIRLEGFEL